MRFSILGPLSVRDDNGRTVPIGGARLRRLLVLLLLSPGRTVGTERLIDGIWGEDRNGEGPEPPASAGNALQALVSRLRRALGPDVPLVGDTTGYRLEVPRDQVDLCAFDDLVRRGRRAHAEGDARTAARLLGDALALWRGPALADLADSGGADSASDAVRLAEQHRATEAEHLAIRLELGEHADVLPDIEGLVAREPLSEHPVELLIRALAGAGRQADALAAYDRLRTALAEELGIDPSQRMRDLHLRLLRGELDEDPGQGGPAPEAPAAGDDSAERGPPPPTRLPSALTSFVARDTEVDSAVDLLRGQRLVTLIGPGGSGKTRLSIETGARFAERSPELAPDGVWFVELAPLTNGADIPHAVLAALGLREHAVLGLAANPSAPSGGPVDRVVEALGDQRLLVVVDNCEHLVTAAAEVAERLLAGCPGLRILATSREPLSIAGERLMAVPSLALPPEGATPEEAVRYPSVRLFRERVSDVSPGFAVDERNVEHVVRICRELDGMPLALELAAARVRAMPVPQLAARLCDRFRLLTNGSRFALARHQTLQAVVDWSWELLDDAERTLLRRLSVFAGGATLDAVERVGSDHGDGWVAATADDDAAPADRDVWSVLFALVDKSLVTADPAPGDDAQPRYRMLETVRAYGALRLAESGEEDAVRRAHAEYVLGVWRESDPHLRGAEQLTWLARLRAEHDNLTAALRWAVDVRDAALALDLVHASQWYWQMGDSWADLSRWSAEALQVTGDHPPEGRTIAYAECLFVACAGDEMREHMEKGVQDAQRVLDEAGIAPEDHRGLFFIPVYQALMGHRPEETLRRLEASAARQEPWLRAVTLAFIGLINLHRGRARQARDQLVTAMEEFRRVGDRWGTTQTLVIVSEVVGLSDQEGELALLDEGIEFAAEMGMRHLVTILRIRRTFTLVSMGRVEDARRDVEAGRPAATEFTLHAMFRLGEAELLRASGRAGEARAQLLDLTAEVERASAITRAQIEPMWRCVLAAAAADLGDRAQARHHAVAAWRALQSRMRHAPQMAHVLERLATETARDDPERAATLLGNAESVRGLPNETYREVRRLRAWLRERQGADAFERAYRAGAATPPDEVVPAVTAWVEEWARDG